MTKSKDPSLRKRWRTVRTLVRRITLSATQSTVMQTENPKEIPDIPIQQSFDILPIDILREIFVASVSFGVTPARNREVLRLCQVSSMWRKAAIGTSELWSSLSISIAHFPFDVKVSRRATRFWECVETWLDRSEARDISLSIQGVQASPPSIGFSCASCLKLVEIIFIPHARRICYVHGLTPHTLEELSRHPLPSLRSLILHPDSIFPNKSIESLCLFAPNLRRLRVDSLAREFMATPRNRAMFPFFKQLTHLITHVEGRHMLSQLFSTFSNLEAIVLYYQQYSPFSPHSLDTLEHEVLLPKLSTLTIVLVSQFSLDPCLFRFLSMPALQTFRVGSFHQRTFRFFSHLQTDLLHGFEQISAIRRLSIFFDSLAGDPGMEQFFSQLPDLEELDIQDCLDYENLFARLIHHRKQLQKGLVPSLLPVFPHLRLLTLDIRQMETFELRDRHFVEFINTQLVLQPLFRVLVYVSGKAPAIYGPMVRMAKQASLPIDLVVWDEKFGSRGDRWKYRMHGEVGRWVTESPD